MECSSIKLGHRTPNTLRMRSTIKLCAYPRREIIEANKNVYPSKDEGGGGVGGRWVRVVGGLTKHYRRKHPLPLGVAAYSSVT